MLNNFTLPHLRAEAEEGGRRPKTIKEMASPGSGVRNRVLDGIRRFLSR